MANELAYSLSATFLKSAAQVSRASGTVNVTVSGAKYGADVQNIGTSDESLDLGDIGTIGFAMFHNLDATNYLTIGSDGTLYPLKLKPGEWAFCRWNAAAIHAKANTAACNLEYILIED